MSPQTESRARPGSPAAAWDDMVRGNARFVAGTPLHPRQDVERRAELADGQAPTAALFGCSDSRLSAEIIFDKGLGDLFVIRNAGQIASESVIGSLEYAVAVLQVPLIVVLSHDSCGAVKAAIDSQTAEPPTLPPHIVSLISRIIPAVHEVGGAGAVDAQTIDAGQVGLHHLRGTIAAILESSELISDAIATGTLAIVGANYALEEGVVRRHAVIGSLDAN